MDCALQTPNGSLICHCWVTFRPLTCHIQCPMMGVAFHAIAEQDGAQGGEGVRKITNSCGLISEFEFNLNLS